MASTEKEFTHEPLRDPRNIRVLILSPSRELEAPLIGSLEEISVDDLALSRFSTRGYEAISYVWGVMTGTLPLIIEGKGILSITPNCEQALRNLRHKRRSRRLWIDAVCIDQNSPDEKTIQIPLMGAVYENANKTLVWLGAAEGEGEEGPKLAFRRAKFLAVVYQDLPFFPSKTTKRLIGIKARDFDAHPWFRRVWTIQEFALSNRGQILFCYGRHCLDYSDILHSVFDVADRFESYATNRLHLLERRKDSWTELINLLLLVMFSQATDARDKVYGILALLDRKCETTITPLPVDYSKTAWHVSADFTKWMIRATSHLGVLALQVPLALRIDDPRPGWALDLDLDRTECKSQRHFNREYFLENTNSREAFCASPSNSGPDTALLASPDEDPSVLRLRGLKVDVITDVCARYPHSRQDLSLKHLEQAWQSWSNLVAKAEQQQQPSSPKYTEDTLQDIRGYEIEVFNLTENHNDKNMELFMSYSIPGLQERLRAAGDTLAFSNSRGSRFGRALFLTESGFLGTTLGDVKVGDFVLLLAGGSTPFLVRPQGPQYEFLGPILVFGMLFGEAWPKDAIVSELDIYELV